MSDSKLDRIRGLAEKATYEDTDLDFLWKALPELLSLLEAERQERGIIICEECKGLGFYEDEGRQHSCKVCDGDPRIDFATVKAYAQQIDDLLARASRAEQASKEATRILHDFVREPHDVEDGFGSVWPPCEKHNCSMEVVRPGSAICAHCKTEEYTNRLLARAESAESSLATERGRVIEIVSKYRDAALNRNQGAGNLDSLIQEIQATEERTKP